MSNEKDRAAPPSDKSPRTDAAWQECVRQGGKHEPFHGPLIELARQLERELALMTEQKRVLERAYADHEAALSAIGTYPVSVARKGRWSPALYYADYWWVKKSHAERTS